MEGPWCLREEEGFAMAGTASPYEELIRRVRMFMLLHSCGSVLGWDQQTYMPPKGTAHRAEQLGLLAGLAHAQFTSPELGDCLAAAEASPNANEADPAVNLREIRRLYDRATRVPGALVEEIARTTAQAQDVWIAARKASDFAQFRPWLDKIIRLKREEAAAKAAPPFLLCPEMASGGAVMRLAELNRRSTRRLPGALSAWRQSGAARGGSSAAGLAPRRRPASPVLNPE